MRTHTLSLSHTCTHTHTHTLNLCGVSNSICLSALSLILFSSSLSRSLFSYNSSHTEPLLPYSSSSSHPSHPSPSSPPPSLAHFASFSPIFLFFPYYALSLRFNLSSLSSLRRAFSFLLTSVLLYGFFFLPLLLCCHTLPPAHSYSFHFFSPSLSLQLSPLLCIPLSSVTHVPGTWGYWRG